MKKIVKVLKRVLILFLGLLVFLTGQTTFETIKINKEIKNFINKAVLDKQIDTEKGTIKFYKVSRETYYPDEFEREPFFEGDYFLPGSEGDIFVTRQAPFPNMPGIYEFVTFYFGGHASYIGEDNEIYEVNGFIMEEENILDVIINGGKSTTIYSTYDNYWLNPYHRIESSPGYSRFGSFYRTEWIGLRVKNVTKEEISQVTSFMDKLVEKQAQYNHLFILATKNKYYCTDMMSRAYHTITLSNGERKYNLNRDGVVVTVNDLILSEDTYISYYFKFDKKGVSHFYYID